MSETTYLKKTTEKQYQIQQKIIMKITKKY